MQTLNHLKFHCLVGRPHDNIASCDFDSRIANLEALPPSCRELHANIELIIVPHLTTRALPCAGVTYCLDNPGSGEVVLFDVCVKRSRKPSWDLPLALAGAQH